MDAVNKALAPLRRRVANMVARAVVSLADDTRQLQLLQMQLLATETADPCERFQQYGLTSVPFPGAEAVIVFAGGHRDHPLVLAVDDRRHRKTGLQPGEVALYDDQGNYVWLKRGGVVEIKASGGVSVIGNLTVSGDATVNGTTGVTIPNGTAKAGTIDLKTHKHTGVTAGGALSGGPQ